MRYFLIGLMVWAGAAMAATPLFQGELDITDIVIHEEYVSYRITGTFDDGSVVGFTALDVATNDLVSTETITGDVDIWQVTNIVAQSAGVVTADVVYAQSGTSTVGMVGGVAAVFTVSTNHVGYPQQPSLTGARISQHMQNEIRNYSLRRIDAYTTGQVDGFITAESNRIDTLNNQTNTYALTNDTRRIDFTGADVRITNAIYGNAPTTLDDVYDIIQDFAMEIFYGSTNAHPTIPGAGSLVREVPSEQLVVTNLAVGTNYIGTFYTTNATDLIREGKYFGRFWLSKDAATDVYSRMDIVTYCSDAASKTTQDVSAVSLMTRQALDDYRLTGTIDDNITGSTNNYLGIDFYLIRVGQPSVEVTLYLGDPYDTHLETPGYGRVEGYALSSELDAVDVRVGTIESNYVVSVNSITGEVTFADGTNTTVRIDGQNVYIDAEGGAGTITNILSTDGSVVVTDPGGPEPDLSVTNAVAGWAGYVASDTINFDSNRYEKVTEHQQGIVALNLTDAVLADGAVTDLTLNSANRFVLNYINRHDGSTFRETRGFMWSAGSSNLTLNLTNNIFIGTWDAVDNSIDNNPVIAMGIRCLPDSTIGKALQVRGGAYIHDGLTLGGGDLLMSGSNIVDAGTIYSTNGVFETGLTRGGNTVLTNVAYGTTDSTAYRGDWGAAVSNVADAALPKAGGTMDGDIAMGGNDIVDAGTITTTNLNVDGESIHVGGLRQVLVYTDTGSDTFVKADYSWLRAVRVKVQAGGGSGAGATTTPASQSSFSSGGGGGGYAESFLLVGDLSASEDVVVGAGGAGVAGDAGNSGSASSFGAHAAANGGTRGIVRTATGGNTGRTGGSGGSVTAGQIQIPGGAGGTSIQLPGTLGMHGYGGASFLSNQTRWNFNTTLTSGENGNSGNNYGGGGEGGGNTAEQTTARAGGNGANGIVIVELYD